MFAQDIQNNKVKGNGYNFIDLFAGAGGLSEGFFQAGFNPIAHVEMNPYAAQTLETRSCYYYLKKVNNLDLYYDYLRGNISRKDFIRQIPKEVLKTVICETMSKQSLPGIFEKIDTILREDSISQVDVIVGGPPCQAYSLVGRAQSSHMEIPMEQDPRNSLYLLYADFLKRYNPKMFVFENVMGIKSANGGATWRNIQSYFKRIGFEYLFEKLEPEKAKQRNFHLIDELELMLGVFPDVIAGVRKSARKIADEIKNLRVDIVHGHAYYYDFANDHNIQYYMLMLDKLIERMNLKLVGFNDEEIKTFRPY